MRWDIVPEKNKLLRQYNNLITWYIWQGEQRQQQRITTTDLTQYTLWHTEASPYLSIIMGEGVLSDDFWRLDSSANTMNYTNQCHTVGHIMWIAWDPHRTPLLGFYALSVQFGAKWLKHLWGWVIYCIKSQCCYTLRKHSWNGSCAIKMLSQN